MLCSTWMGGRVSSWFQLLSPKCGCVEQRAQFPTEWLLMCCVSVHVQACALTLQRGPGVSVQGLAALLGLVIAVVSQVLGAR